MPLRIRNAGRGPAGGCGAGRRSRPRSTTTASWYPTPRCYLPPHLLCSVQSWHCMCAIYPCALSALSGPHAANDTASSNGPRRSNRSRSGASEPVRILIALRALRWACVMPSDRSLLHHCRPARVRLSRGQGCGGAARGVA
eukprot:556934-Rhodomonas_salina.3